MRKYLDIGRDSSPLIQTICQGDAPVLVDLLLILWTRFHSPKNNAYASLPVAILVPFSPFNCVFCSFSILLLNKLLGDAFNVLHRVPWPGDEFAYAKEIVNL